MPLGGTAFMPLQTAGAMRSLATWSYSKWSDPRLKILDDFVVINGMAAQPALKVGYLNAAGWLAYLKEDVLFIKRFIPQTEKVHPDNNVNAEIFVEDKCVELESVAPLVILPPGEMVDHVETWQWLTGIKRKRSLDETVLWISSLVNEP